MTDSVIGLEQDQLNKDLRYYQESIVNIDFIFIMMKIH